MLSKIPHTGDTKSLDQFSENKAKNISNFVVLRVAYFVHRTYDK